MSLESDFISQEETTKLAALQGDTNLLLELLEDGAPFIVDSVGQTVLHLAALAGHLHTVAALLDRGCDSNVLDNAGRSALQVAAGGGHLELVRLLLTAGAAVDQQDEVERSTALHQAAQHGYSQSIALLCSSRANVYMKNRAGFAALHVACQNGHNQSCRVLLTSGCRPDIKNNFGDSPLHTAARYGHAGVTRILISAKCKVSQQNKNGDTALHIAAAMGKRKLTRILVEAGVNINRICDRISQDRRQIVSHIQQSNSHLSNRLESLERRTKHEVRQFEEAVKENMAEERTACQDRLDRRALRERLDSRHRQTLRDQQLKLEISGWLQAIITDLGDAQTEGEGEQRKKQDVVIRKLMRRKSQRETKAIWSEIRNGVLRRTNSVEDVSEEVEEEKKPGLTVMARPVQTRVRHNSDTGHYDDVKLVKQKPETEDNVYENVTFFQGSARFGQTTKSGVRTRQDWERLTAITNNRTQEPHLGTRRMLTSPDDYEHICSLATKQSDSGSVGSHNDSGYGTRLGQTSSSPELTQSDTDTHQLPQYSPYIYTHNSIVISPSSLV